LEYALVPKPGSSKDNPVYYGLNDFYIGSMLDIYGHRFCLNAVDRFVLDFIEGNPGCFTEQVRQNIREYFECKDKGAKPGDREKPCGPGKEVCEEPVGEGFFACLDSVLKGPTLIRVQRIRTHIPWLTTGTSAGSWATTVATSDLSFPMMIWSPLIKFVGSLVLGILTCLRRRSQQSVNQKNT